MVHEGVLDSSRAAGDRGGGSITMEHDRRRSGGDRVDGSSSMERAYKLPVMETGSGSAAPEARAGFGASRSHAEQGDGSVPYRNRVSISIDEAIRRGSGTLDNEDDVLIRNDPAPATKEAAFKGLVSNDIYYIWNHGPKFGGGFQCRYCRIKSRGGGATRFREHLGGITGEVRGCPNVPRNVRLAMRDSRDEARRKKRENANRKLRLERDIIEGMYPRDGVINIEDDEQLHMALQESLRDKNVSRAVQRRRGSGSGVRVSLGNRSITAYFDKELSSNKVSVQPKISTALNIESKDILGQAWAKKIQANDIAGLTWAFCTAIWTPNADCYSDS